MLIFVWLIPRPGIVRKLKEMDKPSGNSFNIFGFPTVLFTYTLYNFGASWAQRQSDQGRLYFGDENTILEPWWFSESVLVSVHYKTTKGTQEEDSKATKCLCS